MCSSSDLKGPEAPRLKLVAITRSHRSSDRFSRARVGIAFVLGVEKPRTAANAGVGEYHIDAAVTRCYGIESARQRGLCW